MSIRKKLKYGNDDFGKACQTLDCGYKRPTQPTKGVSWRNRILCSLLGFGSAVFQEWARSGIVRMPTDMFSVIFWVGLFFVGGWAADWREYKGEK